MTKEQRRIEYVYWRKSKLTFLKGIDKNETIPDYAKEDLKKLVAEHFKVIGQTIVTYELLYLKKKS